MAIKTWILGNKTHFQISVNVRSKNDPSIRIQKQESGALDSEDAEAINSKLSRKETELRAVALREVFDVESAGILWGDLVEHWCTQLHEETTTLSDEQNLIAKKISKSTARAYMQSVLDFTSSWNKKAATEISPGGQPDLWLRH
jgi:hypothetical protein